MASGAEHIDFFGVLSKSRDEIVLGEDDRHLDFRALLLIPPRRDGEGAELVATTVVRCHNLVGKDHLFAIAPFHRQVFRSHLATAVGRGWK